MIAARFHGAIDRRCTVLDLFLVTVMTNWVKMLTVSKAKATFSGIARKVVRSKKPVIVRVPDSFIQIAPYELPEEVAPFPAGSLKLLPREVNSITRSANRYDFPPLGHRFPPRR